MKHIILFVLVFFLILGVAGVLMTTIKIEKIEQIRGWKPGAVAEMEVVRQKFEDPQNETCWIALTNESIRRPGPHRTNLQPEIWDRLRIGDPIEIVRLPGDSTPYTRDGIFASDGNYALDHIFLVVEYAVIVVSIVGAVAVLGVLALGEFVRSRKPCDRPISRPKNG